MADNRADEERPLTRSERINIRISITQTVLALAGIFIGSVALFAALGESDAVRRQLDTSVWPRLAIIRSFSGEAGSEEFSIEVENAGIGPAIVKSFRVTHDGEPLADWTDLASRITDAENVGYSNETVAGSIIRAGVTIRAAHFEATSNEDPLIAERLRAAVDDGVIVFELCYCSVFDRCWRQTSTERDPEPVRRCPGEGPDDFEG